MNFLGAGKAAEVDERRTGAGGSCLEAGEGEEVDDDVDAGGGFEALPPLAAPNAARIPALLRLRHKRDEGGALAATWGPERAGRGRDDDDKEEEEGEDWEGRR